ncbi:MAG: DUF1704 domain-containing protein [Polyangiaceae bacterium]
MRRRSFESLLSNAERSIALLERCRPLNFVEERERLLQGLLRGDVLVPRFHYVRSPHAAELAAGLGSLADASARGGGWGSLYAGRALELHHEAQIVANVGTEQVRAHSRARYRGAADSCLPQARQLACTWAQEPAGEESGPLFRSEDEEQPHSLLSAMRREVGERRLAFRVVTSSALASCAATGAGVIVVRKGLTLSERSARRVVLHEVLGHALPRHRAMAEDVGLFRTGSAGGPDEEEGRALLIEARMGLLDAPRRRALGLRHLAALSVHEGASFPDTMRLLGELGATPAECVDVSGRVHRGGGLGREVVYLEAYLRLEAEFAADPHAEGFLERGRVSVSCAREMERLGAPPEVLPAVRAA